MKTVLAVGVDDPAVEVSCLDGGCFISERDAVFNFAIDRIRTVDTDADGAAGLCTVKGKTVFDGCIFSRTPDHKAASGRGIVGTVGKNGTSVNGSPVTVTDMDAVGIEKGFAVADGGVDRVIDADAIGTGTHAVDKAFMGVVACDHESFNGHIDRFLQIETVVFDD